MKNKLLCVLLLSALTCGSANADMIYSYTDSNGNGNVGLIDVEKNTDGSFDITVVSNSISDRTFSNRIYASGYKRNKKSYVIVTESPEYPDNTVNSHDMAFIYNYDPEGEWTLENSFDMYGALDVRRVVVSGNGKTLFAAAHGFEDETLNGGIIEYSASTFKPTGNSYVFSQDVDGCIVQAEDIFINKDRIYTLFTVRSNDNWINSNVSVLDGQLLWKSRYSSYRLNPQAVDFALSKNNYIIAACMGDGGVSGEISVTSGRNFVTLVSADNAGEAVGEVLAVGRDFSNGAYFIASNNDVETLYHCSGMRRTDDSFTLTIVDTVTPDENDENSEYISGKRKILWDSDNKLVFVMAGDKIIILDEDDEIIKTIKASDLGGYPGAISFIQESSSSSSSKNSGCNGAYYGLAALIIPAVFAFKFKKIKSNL